MIAGVTCTVIIGLIAIHQTWSARRYRDAAVLYRAALVGTQKALEYQRQHMVAANGKLVAIATALPLHHAAAERGDARVCNAILAVAIANANAIRVETPGTDGAAP